MIDVIPIASPQLFLIHCSNVNCKYISTYRLHVYVPPSRFHYSVSVILNRCLLFRRLLRIPKLFVMGFNRISTRERAYVTHCSAIANGRYIPIYSITASAWNFCLAKATYVSLRVWTVYRRLRVPLRIRAYTYPCTYSYLPRSRAVNRSIALYGIIVKSVANLCVSRVVASFYCQLMTP